MTAPQIIINGKAWKLIAYGYCQCGCGRKTTIPDETNLRIGRVKGRPMRFIHNHHGRGEQSYRWNGGRTKSSHGYVLTKAPDHPKANRHGYVFEHILVCEKALGKYLPLLSEPHHFDGDKANNVNGNLVICQDRAYHMLLEQRTRALKVCGHANWRVCEVCTFYDDPKNLTISGRHAYHKSCAAEYRRKRRSDPIAPKSSESHRSSET